MNTKKAALTVLSITLKIVIIAVVALGAARYSAVSQPTMPPPMTATVP